MNRSVIVSLAVLAMAFYCASAETISPEQFYRMVVADLKDNSKTQDSVTTVLSVRGVGAGNSDFFLAPVIRDGKLVAVYRDDPKRSSVARVEGESVLRDKRQDLFTKEGAERELRKYGITDPQPIAISCGPMSLLGSLKAGWWQPTSDSYLLMSLSGKVVTQADVAKYWPVRAAALETLRSSLDSEK